jgi:predicted metal-binding protein
MDIVKLCIQLGAANAIEVSADKLVLQSEIRKLCEQNACGRFARNYSCPPFVGEVDELIDKLKSFTTAIIWQNIYPLEDSFDFEGMMDAQAKHNVMTLEVARRVYAVKGQDNILVLSAGGCFLCDECAAIIEAPCRRAADALVSLEAYGVNVIETSNAVGMNYINGINTVTYFSGCLVK